MRITVVRAGWVLPFLTIALLAGCGGGNTVAPPLEVTLAPPDALDTAALSVADQLRADVQMLAQQIGDRRVARYTALTQAADYLAAQFTAAGYVVTRQSFTAGGKTVSNIVANPRRPNAALPLLLVGAHYDTDNNPGADDNASGVAFVLELARLLAGQPTASRVRFVAFVNEEEPWNGTAQSGAVVSAKALKSANENVRGMINFDMTGYFPAGSKRFWLGAGRGAATLADRAAVLFAQGTTMPTRRMAANDPDLPYCDNGAFTARGYQALLFASPGYFTDPNHHRRTDTWDKLSYPDMARAVSGMAAVVKGL